MQGNAIVRDFVDEFLRYKRTGAKALEQFADADLNHVPAHDGNSAATIVRHISGNLQSRFTDFLTTDGEKPWRDRDGEFEDHTWTRAQILDFWNAGWEVLEREAGALTDADLDRPVKIRGEALTVHAALSRSLAHLAYHVGQIVLLARVATGENWRWISIPKGKSQEYNRAPNLEKKP